MSRQAKSWKVRVRNVIFRWAVLLGLTAFVLWSTGCMERWFYYPDRGPTPVTEAPTGSEAVEFLSADGTKLFGWFIPARGTTTPEQRRTHAIILHVHGNAGNILSHAYFTEHLPPAGFNVFIFDFRGYGQSEGSAHHREDLIADTSAALDVLLQRDDVAPTRIGMYGQSLGGAIALNVMADRPEIRCAVFESSFASWREVAANSVGGDPPFFAASWLAAMCVPDQLRPIDAIARIDRPMLLLHGDADPLVPVSHGRRLAAAAGECARLMVLRGGGHNTLRDTNPEVDRATIDFFREHLGADE